MGEDDAVLLWVGVPDAIAEGVVAGEWDVEAAFNLDFCEASREACSLTQLLDARK
jgi:hypothetical protein